MLKVSGVSSCRRHVNGKIDFRGKKKKHKICFCVRSISNGYMLNNLMFYTRVT